MKYTILKDNDGEHMICSGCDEDRASIKEFAGFCEICWLTMTPAKRAILQGKEPPVVEVVHDRVLVREMEPAPSKFMRVMDVVWRVGVTMAVVAWTIERLVQR